MIESNELAGHVATLCSNESANEFSRSPVQKAPLHNPLLRHNRTNHCNQIERQRRLLQNAGTQKRHEKSPLVRHRFQNGDHIGG
ncbi:hypothetical protein RB1542 [Rhodopirellula baltica SH 1]|uniref:Uncharacterized protein n=1 Tax=Rhodopirellula baltica (strain DSM 10527 / NCIMB 13988 / SH1) TaxID=243090 RepID=Q7UX60_RHOBA|nr:hypothetical protein RB1542 [Rhodopirellula baltica SH 1]